MGKNTIWVTGASGKLGSVLTDLLQDNVDYKVIATDKDVDITDSHAVTQAVEIYRPNIIINCASISDPEYCESNIVEAFKVNALGARNLATASRHVNAKIIQISTDDVFSGVPSGFLTEYDTPNPNTIYGKSKLAGENYVRELNPKHLIIRSSWVYGIGKGDYFSTVVEYGKNNMSFNAPKDHISSPTNATELADFIITMLDEAEYGIYHASCEGACSRFDFAKEILIGMGYDGRLVKGVSAHMDGGHTSTVLENLMMKMTEVYEMSHWQDSLKEYMEEIKEG